ncbi:hypothetical protein EDC04DRAFT_1635562 [Pisolithus marmoratus]|nr:hypothetical protein EDC04DRAFT_1635562 [Pisolithus marmoratus]
MGRYLQGTTKCIHFTTRDAWTDPDQGRRHGPHNSCQIRLGALAVVNQDDIPPKHLFRLKRPQGHKLPNGNYRIRSVVSNQPLGTQPIVGRRPAYRAVVPVPSAAPQTFTVQQVNGLEDTYLITREGRYTRDMWNAVYAIQSSPAQQWVITHRQQPDAYTITKLNTRQAWTEPDQYGRDGRRNPDSPRQIRLEPLTTTKRCVCSDICPNQLFKFEALLEPRRPNAHPAAPPGRSAAPRRVRFKLPS